MIGLDTNVLVRWLVQDDALQSRRATALIERELSKDAPGFVSVVTIAEVVWVLERAYAVDSAEIAASIEGLLAAEALVIDREQDVFTAMVALKEGRASFSDALIAAIGKSSGCRSTLTFDRRAARHTDFVLL
ncbi:MAG: type II toxin-antitoxin system VapC family toxin [Parvularculaceae bacterium]